MAYTKYSLTPANNTAAPPDGVPEGMLPSAVNDTMRDMMAQIRDCGDGIRDGTYTMTAPKITGGTITGGTINGATFAAGTVSLPSITTTGDTNTGIYFPAADTIAFTEGGVESMRIDSSGNLLVGTTSAATSSTLNVVGAGYQPIYVNTTIAGGGGAAFSRSGTQAMYVGTAGSSWLTGSSTADGLMRSEANMLFSVGNTECMRIPAAGGLQVVNCVSVGNATPANSGAGITFPATQSASSDANTLDDYEEGTWTPVINGTSTAGTASYSPQNGKYTKIGRLVFVELYIVWTGGTGSGDLSIGGLPFTSTNNTLPYPGLAIGYWNDIAITSGQVPMAYQNSNTTRIDFICMNAGGAGSGTVPYDGSGALQIAGCYTV